MATSPESRRHARASDVPWYDPGSPVRVGISACLSGEAVRYDGGHRRDAFVAEVLAAHVDLVPVCPEVEIGLGVPRPKIRLEKRDGDVRLMEPDSGRDLTARIRRWARSRIGRLRREGLDGFVLKSRSPSCGPGRLAVWQDGKPGARDGVGMFARALREAWPTLPVEDEGRLHDAALRERFVEHVFCAHRWRTLVRRGLTRRRLVAFHTAHKLLFLAHNEAGYRRMGRIVASLGSRPDREVYAAYEEELHRVMARRATRSRHVNVLQHAAGHLRRVLDARERRELHAVLERYAAGSVPLVVPATLVGFLARRHEIAWLAQQVYFEPHPAELMVRNHV